MSNISYHLITYRGKSRILLRFAHNKTWNERIKKVADARWSNTLKGWHIPDNEETEIGRLFKAITNLKHKAIVFTAYSAGLRVSEVVNLKQKDIDSTRMTIYIEQAKGKKDRYVNLSPVLLDILRKYLKQQEPRPKVYLFEGQIQGTAYSTRSAQQIFIDAKKRANIPKHVTFHGLRHSFATHLLEKGVDIKYIKDILGHFDIRTTERYVHVARKQLVNIASPLDDLFEKGLL
jgi:integrase/recombinase XerD